MKHCQIRTAYKGSYGCAMNATYRVSSGNTARLSCSRHLARAVDLVMSPDGLAQVESLSR